MHPLALLLPLLIFVYFCITGKAFMLAIRLPGSYLRSWLIAPVMGFSLQILIVSIINQVGYPVEKFARWEAFLILLIAIAVFLWKRPVFPWRYLRPFAGSSLIVLLYAGWPLFLLGLGWLSYCNDDMANYCLAAKRHLHHGFFSVPTVREVIGGDYSQNYWFLYVGGFVRYGSEVLLAWVAGVTGLNPLKIFMPTILCLGMTVPLATASLARAGRCTYRAMVVASLLLAFSPLSLLGLFYQLIAQIAGLGLLCSIAALLMTGRMPSTQRSFLKTAVIIGTLGATFCITYPELSPFFILGFFLWLVVKSLQSLSIFWKPILLVFFSSIIALIWLRYNILVYLMTILNQVKGGTQIGESDILFPYFLVPSGLPSLFGFLAIGDSFSKTYGYIMMVLTTVFLIVFTISMIRSIRQGKGHSCIALVMFLMGGWLFYKHIGFGTFKLAMFIQPVLAIELALFFCGLGLLRLFFGIGCYCIFQFPSGLFYGKSSLGNQHASFVEVTGASHRNLNIKETNTPTIAIESAHIVVEKFTACLATPGKFLVMNMKDGIGNFHPTLSPLALYLINKIHPYSFEIFSMYQLVKDNEAMFQKKELLGTNIRCLINQPHSNITSLRPPREIEIFNGLFPDNELNKEFFQSKLLRPNEVLLSFVDSSKGEHYYNTSKRKAISFYQNQKDFYSPVQSVAGIGSYLLFQVDPPSQEIFLRVAVTKSILGEERTALYHHAVVKGEWDQDAGFLGNGAANLYIGPIKPFYCDGTNYVALDFCEEGQRPIKDIAGIMGLYRKEQPIDPRYLVGYARDISAITADHYRIMERPREVSNFPKDLAEAKTLEFSGWYEDGFISQTSYIILGHRGDDHQLIIKGSIPTLGKFVSLGQRVTIFANGIKICDCQKLNTGSFELNYNLPKEIEQTTKIKITIIFDLVEKLPHPDSRPISAKINYLGFKK